MTEEVKGIRDKAEALRVYARQSGQSLEMQNRCAEIKLRAERRGGELLREVERAQGKNGQGLRATLAQSGIADTTAKRWQTIAKIAPESFERHIAEVRDQNRVQEDAGDLVQASHGAKHGIRATDRKCGSFRAVKASGCPSGTQAPATGPKNSCASAR